MKALGEHLPSLFCTFVVAAVLLTSGVSIALPPEGFENFALIGRGKGTRSLAIDGMYNRPAWRSDSESLQFYAGWPTENKNYLTVGARSLAAPQFGDRFAAFARWDWTFFDVTSIAIKYIHEEWRYIATSKETWALDYNFFIPFGEQKTGFYFSLGAYYRWMKQRWNDPWSSPLNYNTKDQEWFFQSVMGWQVGLGDTGSYMTFDWNLRDQFSYYNFDNMAFDLSLNFDGGDSFLFRLTSGVRTSALTMGTGYPAEYYGGMGFVIY
ncbi:MAG: hypothetical protein AB7F59_05515 [Bdellovibrionales bacterium]